MLLAENTIESNLPPLGKFQMHFTGCKDKGTGATCTGLGEAAGVSLVGGTWHLVWDEKAGSAFELTVATLFLLNAAHFNCTALVLLKLEGEQLCLDLDPLTLSKTHEFHCIVKKATEPIEQEDTWCKKDVAKVCTELVTPKLNTSVNEAAGKASALLSLGSWTVDGVAISAMPL